MRDGMLKGLNSSHDKLCQHGVQEADWTGYEQKERAAAGVCHGSALRNLTELPFRLCLCLDLRGRPWVAGGLRGDHSHGTVFERICASHRIMSTQPSHLILDLNATCPSCQYSIPPNEIAADSAGTLKCPRCEETFLARKGQSIPPGVLEKEAS
jgi:hypothetical protein